MKRKSRLQLVALSTQATALFSRAVELANGSEYVFPGSSHGRKKGVWRDEHIGQESVSRAMAKAREIACVIDIRVHDMRKCITTWLDENRMASPDVLDRILHHGGNGVTASHYNFATLEGPVRKALQAWADHVEAVAAGQKEPKANVVSLVRA
jgi:integrase